MSSSVKMKLTTNNKKKYTKLVMNEKSYKIVLDYDRNILS